MKKKIIIPIVILIVLIILFVPFSKEMYDDGGTRTYSALTYKIVIWNKMINRQDETGKTVGFDKYQKTTVHWFPESILDIDELWEMEIAFEE